MLGCAVLGGGGVSRRGLFATRTTGAPDSRARARSSPCACLPAPVRVLGLSCSLTQACVPPCTV